ncbi:MAG: hypothetical protein MUP53_07805, partial [Bacteroidales bacterium]|nr:hypothetical protein [Bacteroidales bacterium]
NDIQDVSQEVGTLSGSTYTFTTGVESSKPHISTITPRSGVAGSQVKISGYGFDPEEPATNIVNFNSGVNASVINASLTSITVEVPEGAISGPVTVTVSGEPDDQFPDNMVTYFYIIPPSDPSFEAYANTNTGAQSRDAALDFSGATAYVTNSGENTVSVVKNLDTYPDEVMPRIQVGTTPMKIVINPLGTSAYVTNFNSHDVSVIDLTDGETKYDVIETIDVGAFPFGIVASGSEIYVANSECISVINVDPASGGFDHVVANIHTGTINRDLDITYDGGILLVTGDDGLKIIELIQTGLGFDYAITNVNSGTRTRDVSVAQDAGTAIVTTLDGNIFLVNIVPGSESFGAAYYNYNPSASAGDGTTSFDGQFYYVTNPYDDQITVYKLFYDDEGGGFDSSLPGRKVLEEYAVIQVGDGPVGIVNDHDDDKIVSINSGNYSITLIASRQEDQKTKIDLIKDLVTTIQGMINAEAIQENVGNALIIKINDASRNITDEIFKTAINQLKAFIRFVKGLDAGGLLAPDDPYIADYLIETAEKIIYMLQQSGAKSDQEKSVIASFDQSQRDLISESKLREIYPNPFSESVTINYEVRENNGKPDNVLIRIYDISGRLVGTLVDNPMRPGSYSTVWKGIYENGKKAP